MSENSNLPVVAITMGDPAGVGPEIVLKAISKINGGDRPTLLLLGDVGLWRKVKRETGIFVDFHQIDNIDQLKEGAVNMISLSSINLDQFEYGKSLPGLGMISTFYIIKATELALAGKIDALVTAPINYGVLYEAGYDYPDHSSLLKDHLKAERIVPMLIGSHIKLAHVTTHIPVCEVARQISEEKLLFTFHQVDQLLRDAYSIESPRLGVAALNPHASEGGRFGGEEDAIIAPAIRKAVTQGLNIAGPTAVDTLMVDTVRGNHDVAICMNHDQGHLAFNLLEREPGVNLTLGLPIPRTAPTHGAHYELAGRGKASCKGMSKALNLAIKLAYKHKQES